MATYQDVLVLKDKVSDALKKINKNFEKTNNATKKVQSSIINLQNKFKKMEVVGGKIKNFGNKISATFNKVAIGATALGTAFVLSMNKAADFADNIDKQSQKIGMSAEKYQELNFVLSQNGMNVDNLQMGYKTLTNQMAAAKKGTKTSVAIFQRLGVAFLGNNKQLRSTDAVFDDVLKSLLKMKNPTERMSLAIKLFGRNAQELAPLLNSGLESYEKLKKVARDKGMILSESEIKNAVKYKDTMDKFTKMFESRIATIAIRYMPQFTEYLDKIMSRTDIWDKLITGIIKFTDKIASLITWFINLSGWQKKLIIGFGVFLAALGPIISTIGTLTIAIGTLGKAITLLLANPLVLTIVGWTAVFAGLVAGIWAAIKAVQTLVGWFQSLINLKKESLNMKFSPEEIEKLSKLQAAKGEKSFIKDTNKKINKKVTEYRQSKIQNSTNNTYNTFSGNITLSKSNPLNDIVLTGINSI